MFENEQVTVKGIVTKVQYGNPHVYVFLDMEMDGRPQPFRLEAGSPSALRELGWTSKVLQHGDRVSVTFSKARDGTNVGLLRQLMKADGTVLPAGSGGQGRGAE